MSYNYIDGGVCAPLGFTAGGVHCGIRKNKEKRDLALIVADCKCAAAAVYTQNLVKGSPLIVTESNISDGYAQAVICNSGNANTCNADGEKKAHMMCEAIAEVLGIESTDVVVASTGVIGQPLPIDPILTAVDALKADLSKDGNSRAAEAIMTTDMVQKQVALTAEIGGKTVTIGAMAKGSGMIHPNMATMLCFVTTDAHIAPTALQEALTAAVNVSFNMVSVDGDTSTNDMVSILASGKASNEQITDKTELAIFTSALTEVLIKLAREVAGDGEGATHLIECRTSGALNDENAKIIAKSVICSSLLKAAIFGADANWGRVLCAMGYAGVPIDISKVSVAFESVAGRISVCENGAGINFSEGTAKIILLEKEIIIDIKMGDGNGSATAWGCDLTYDYVKINGDYRT